MTIPFGKSAAASSRKDAQRIAQRFIVGRAYRTTARREACNLHHASLTIIKAFALLLGASLAVSAVRAATLTVTSTNDSGAGSLRQAIQSAVSGDTINFSVTGMITLSNGELSIMNNLTIVGPSATDLAISGNNIGRVFRIGANAIVNISGLMIRDGHAPNGTNSFNPSYPNGNGDNGGGIYNFGTLTLTSCIITNNRAGNGGGGCAPCDGLSITGGDGGNGGGICSFGTLTLMTCSVSGNSAGGGGWGGSGYQSFGGAGGGGGSGGGIYSQNTLSLTACTLRSNVG